MSAAAGLRALHDSAVRNAAEQERASAGYDTPTGSAGEVFVGMRASGDGDPPRGSSGHNTPQSQEAIFIATAVTLYAGSGDVTFVGHSLGGRHAAIAAMATGSEAVTFNAAGVSTIDRLAARANRAWGVLSDFVMGHPGGVADKGVTNFYLPGDPLTTAQEGSLGLLPSAVGEQVQAKPTVNRPPGIHLKNHNLSSFAVDSR